MRKKAEENPGRIILWLEAKLRRTNLTGRQQQKILFTTDLVLNVIVVVILVVLMRTYIMTPFQVFGISMCNTLNYTNDKCQDGYGDYIIINKSSYLELPGWTVGKPARGDVVVFKPPHNNHEYYIKRVIGLPGDEIKLIDGYVHLYNEQFPDGVKLDEGYLSGDNVGGTFATGGITEFEVPQDKYLVFGDNRKRSSDSRLCFKESANSPSCGENGATPYLDVSLIEGKAGVVLWPLPRIIDTWHYSELDM
jgi:signal peptidase I